jgi:hypothetical protein
MTGMLIGYRLDRYCIVPRYQLGRHTSRALIAGDIPVLFVSFGFGFPPFFQLGPLSFVFSLGVSVGGGSGSGSE